MSMASSIYRRYIFNGWSNYFHRSDSDGSFGLQKPESLQKPTCGLGLLIQSGEQLGANCNAVLFWVFFVLVAVGNFGIYSCNSSFC